MTTRDVEQKLSHRRTCPWVYQECLLDQACPLRPEDAGWTDFKDDAKTIGKARKCKHAGLALTRLHFFVTHPRSFNHPDPPAAGKDTDRG